MNKLLIYFSFGGVTRRIAEYTGIPSVEIKATDPYTDADMLSVNPKARVNAEQGQANFRPGWRIFVPDLDLDFGDDTDLYIGFPLWNLKAPRIIFSFLDDHKEQLSSVNINVFCTSGGSPISGAEQELKETYPDLHWGKFKQFSYTSKPEEVWEWVENNTTKKIESKLQEITEYIKANKDDALSVINKYLIVNFEKEMFLKLVKQLKRKLSLEETENLCDYVAQNGNKATVGGFIQRAKKFYKYKNIIMQNLK